MKQPHPTHAFDARGICLGCAMRRTWPGALTACSVRHEYSLSPEKRAKQKALLAASKKRYSERLKQRRVSSW